jgi:hypothetical protein
VGEGEWGYINAPSSSRSVLSKHPEHSWKDGAGVVGRVPGYESGRAYTQCAGRLQKITVLEGGSVERIGLFLLWFARDWGGLVVKEQLIVNLPTIIKFIFLMLMEISPGSSICALSTRV